MKPQKNILKTIYDHWQFEMTHPGRYLFYGMIFAGLGSVASVIVPIYQIFCSLAALFVVVWLIGYPVRPRVTISGNFPEKTSVGKPISTELTVVNRSRFPIFDLALGIFNLPTSLILQGKDQTLARVNPTQTVNFTLTLQPLRRGFYELPDVRAYTLFPFGILRRGRSKHPLAPLLVLPEFHPLTEIHVPFGNRYQPGGISLTSNIGESPEYIGNREYVPGESVRRLDFRSWARIGKPVVREYQEEYYCRIALVLDTFISPNRKANPEGFAELEAAISLAASVADALSHGEYLIDIFAAGPQLYVFRAGRHTAHFENVLEILACLDACRDNPFETISPAIADELENISTTICIFLDWDESRQQLARSVVEAGSSLKILIVKDGETTLPLDQSDLGDFAQYTPAQIRSEGVDIL